jgi:hypothetical protein
LQSSKRSRAAKFGIAAAAVAGLVLGVSAPAMAYSKLTYTTQCSVLYTAFAAQSAESLDLLSGSVRRASAGCGGTIAFRLTSGGVTVYNGFQSTTSNYVGYATNTNYYLPGSTHWWKYSTNTF